MQDFHSGASVRNVKCTPTRSALLTGRHAIQSGTHSVPIGMPGGWGLVAWERTLGDLLSEAGYACAAYGKGHVGEGSGRWPTDHGFEEWYGPPRTYDEALWPTDPWYRPDRDGVSRMLEIKRGDERGWTLVAFLTRRTRRLRRNHDRALTPRRRNRRDRCVLRRRGIRRGFRLKPLEWFSLQSGSSQPCFSLRLRE